MATERQQQWAAKLKASRAKELAAIRDTYQHADQWQQERIRELATFALEDEDAQWWIDHREASVTALLQATEQRRNQAIQDNVLANLLSKANGQT